MNGAQPLTRAFVSDRHVYFVEAPSVSMVKIGVTDDVERRVRQLELMSPVPVRLLHVIPGAGIGGERQVHDLYDYLRSHGEWFRLTPEIRTAIVSDRIAWSVEAVEMMGQMDEQELADVIREHPQILDWAKRTEELFGRVLALHGAHD